jgi:hypothetical protein
MTPDPKQRRRNTPEPEASSADGVGTSGEGAETAFEAMIRKRRWQADPAAEAPEPPLPPVPAPD